MPAPARKRFRLAALILLPLLLAGGGEAAAQHGRKSGASSPAARAAPKTAEPAPEVVLTPGYAIKPSEVVAPADVAPGQYRRSITPYANWTLICDENFKTKRRICNVAQALLGPDGTNVFSWSLAASEAGQPYFILRAPTGIGETGSLALKVPDGGAEIEVPVKGCTPNFCIGYEFVGPRMRAAIARGLTLDVSLRRAGPTTILSFRVPLSGLSAALSGI